MSEAENADVNSIQIELVHDPGCPHVDDARALLATAFAALGRSAPWVDWRSDAPDLPRRARAKGSPTILVNGNDVAHGPDQEGAACRVYAHADGTTRGVPPLESVIGAIRSELAPG